MMKWHSIPSEDNSASTERAMIPGGWLVRFHGGIRDGGFGGMTFVPDPEHKWNGSSLDYEPPPPKPKRVIGGQTF